MHPTPAYTMPPVTAVKTKVKQRLQLRYFLKNILYCSTFGKLLQPEAIFMTKKCTKKRLATPGPAGGAYSSRTGKIERTERREKKGKSKD